MTERVSFFIRGLYGKNRLYPVLAPLVGCFLLLSLFGGEQVVAGNTLAAMEKEAALVLADPDNVARRRKIEVVFQLAERYATSGETNKALNFYAKALEHHPWNLKGQLRVAELSEAAGDKARAKEAAGLVFKHSEDEALVHTAAKILGEPIPPKPASQAWPSGSNVLALVPLGEVDTWLVLDLQKELEGILKIPVIIRQDPVTLPKPSREPLAMYARDLRSRLDASRNTPQFKRFLETHNLSVEGIEQDETLFTFVEKVLEKEGKSEPLRQFRDELATVRRFEPQVDAAAILTEMGKALQPDPASGRGYLAVTRKDIFSNDSRFVFGIAAIGLNYGVISYHRYTGEFGGTPPNRDRLRDRTTKQALSSVGLMFGLPRCPNPTCARAYAHSLIEHDPKEKSLCTTCQAGFKKKFGP